MENPSRLLNYRFFKSLPVILQSEVTECGLASIAMIANYHGHDVDLTALRRKFSVSARGATLEDLTYLASELDFICRPLRLELDELTQLSLPCILHWDFNHFVVLKKVTSSCIYIHDPAVGVRKIKISEASKHFTGIALELDKAPSFEKQRIAKKIALSDFWTHISGLKSVLVKLFVLSVALQIFAIISPFYLQLIIDDVVISHDENLLLTLAIGFALIMCLGALVRVLRKVVILHLTTQLDIQITSNLFRHLLHLPLGFFERRHLGDILSRFDSLDEIKDLLTTGLIQALVDGLLSISLLIVMFIYSPTLTFIVAIVLLIYILIRLALYRPYRNLNEEVINARAIEDSTFMESIRAIQSIKLFGNEKQRLAIWQNQYSKATNVSIKVFKFETFYQLANDLLFGIENIIVIYLAALFVINNSMSIGMLIAFIAYKNQFTGSVSTLVNMYIQFKMLGLHLERLGDVILTEEEEVSQGLTGRSFNEINGNLRLEKIDFSYSEHTSLLFEEVNFTAEAGTTTAITGASGSGKTTLVKIMLGLLRPMNGKIYIDNIDIADIGVSKYRDVVGTVMQEDQLLSGSIRENICFFEPNASDEGIHESARLAGIYEDINQMPMGFDTLVGDMGSTLSGGQKQRLLLARALFKQPKILFLDEATAHLDADTESLVNDHISKLGITVVLVAHRQETINMADVVYHLEDGVLARLNR